MSKLSYADLHHMSEDSRIQLIGDQAKTKVVAIMLEMDDGPYASKGKIGRYKQKVVARFPEVEFYSCTDNFPVAGVATLKFGPKRT